MAVIKKLINFVAVIVPGNHGGVNTANGMHQRAQYTAGQQAYTSTNNILGLHALQRIPSYPSSHLPTSQHTPHTLNGGTAHSHYSEQHLPINSMQLGSYGSLANASLSSQRSRLYQQPGYGHGVGGSAAHAMGPSLFHSSMSASQHLNGAWTVPPPAHLSSLQQLPRQDGDDTATSGFASQSRPPPAITLTHESEGDGNGSGVGGSNGNGAIFNNSEGGYAGGNGAAVGSASGGVDGQGGGSNSYRSLGTVKGATTGTVQSCPVCSRTFKRSDRLALHVRIAHGAERPITCDICNKPFSRGDSLLVHKRSHDGSLPYRCECGRAFPRKDRLLAHRAVRTLVSAALASPSLTYLTVIPGAWMVLGWLGL